MLAQGLDVIRHVVTAHLCGVRWTTGESTSARVDEDKTKPILQECEPSPQIARADAPAGGNEKQQRSVSRNLVV